MREKLHEVYLILMKDVTSENESKRLAVAIRLFSVVMIVYYAIWILLMLFHHVFIIAFVGVACLAVNIFALRGTYYQKSYQIYCLLNIFTVLWVIVMVVNLGWGYGVQHFIFFLVLLNYFSTYDKIGRKHCYTIFLFLVRLTLFYYAGAHEPMVYYSKIWNDGFQILNSLVTFICLAIFSNIFSESSQELEKKLIRYNEKLIQMASVDELTKLWNRRQMDTYLKDKACQYKNGLAECFSIALGDIDFFKKINDTYGHEGGDLVLKQLSAIMAEFMQNKGKICRYGGEEFLFIFEGMNGDDANNHLNELAKKIRKSDFTYKEEILKVTMTFGLEEYSHLDTMDYIIKRADEKLYMGKTMGRDRVVY